LNYAPIILFTYNRPEHTQKTLDALAINPEAKDSLLFIYCDGAKDNATTEVLDKIKKNIAISHSESRFKHVQVIEHSINKGLANSVVDGVTEIVNKFDKVIVLEDDLISDKWFLKYMNDSLNLYEFEQEIACISGYIYPVAKQLPQTFFIKGADCWGWATWKRAWMLFEKDGEKLLNELESKKLIYDFNFYNTYPYIQMLKDQINKKNNSWAILWYASAYLKNKYTLYPGQSLINNIGIDGSGTHSGSSSYFDIHLLNEKIKVEKISIFENSKAKQIISEYFALINRREKQSIFHKILKRLRLKS
jgi:hypothetical protein